MEGSPGVALGERRGDGAAPVDVDGLAPTMLLLALFVAAPPAVPPEAWVVLWAVLGLVVLLAEALPVLVALGFAVVLAEVAVVFAVALRLVLSVAEETCPLVAVRLPLAPWPPGPRLCSRTTSSIGSDVAGRKRSCASIGSPARSTLPRLVERSNSQSGRSSSG